MGTRPRWFGFIGLVVLVQVSLCCCCLGGAVTPVMTSVPVSKELAQGLRERVTQATSQKGAFALEISEQELTSYIVGRLQSGAGEFPARDMQLEFRDGYVDIWATFIDIAPTEIPVFVQATATAMDGQLVFRITQANAGPYPVPGAMRELIAQSLSETLTELQFNLEVEQVEIVPGKLILTGQVTGDFPALP